MIICDNGLTMTIKVWIYKIAYLIVKEKYNTGLPSFGKLRLSESGK